MILNAVGAIYNEDGDALDADETLLTLEDGSRIDVSAGEDGEGGSVRFRVRRTDSNDDVRMEITGTSTVTGASEVVLEGVALYEDSRITSSDITTYYNEADTFLTNSTTIQERLTTGGLTLEGGTSTDVQVTPGIEVYSTAI